MAEVKQTPHSVETFSPFMPPGWKHDSKTCPCLCHDTGGGVHDHRGQKCKDFYRVGRAV